MHDYYDAPFKASACDPKYVFVRETNKYHIGKQESIRCECTVNGKAYYFTSGVIGFCGGIYPFVKQQNEYFYTMDDFKRNLPEVVNGDAQISRWTYHNNVQKLSDFEKWFKNGQVSNWNWSYTACDDKLLKDVFLDKRVAYFVVETGLADKSSTLITYPLLKKYSFYKMFDVYSAFQQIETYLTNELIRPDEINIVIPDDLKAQSKGFDTWSFRKMSEKKK